MKIIVSQKGKEITVEFYYSKVVDKFVIDKAEEFLVCVDKPVRKNKMKLETLRNARLEFYNTGLLTERVVRAIMLGLCF